VSSGRAWLTVCFPSPTSLYRNIICDSHVRGETLLATPPHPELIISMKYLYRNTWWFRHDHRSVPRYIHVPVINDTIICRASSNYALCIGLNPFTAEWTPRTETTFLSLGSYLIVARNDGMCLVNVTSRFNDGDSLPYVYLFWREAIQPAS
jgi:hypothetical protein